MLMIAVEAATIVVFILIDPLVVFFRKRKSNTVTVFFGILLENM